MNDDLQEYLTALEDIDSQIDHLLEELKETDELEVTLQANLIQTLRQTRSEMDPALLAVRKHCDAPATPGDDSIILQWTPTGRPPRREILEPTHGGDSWSRRLLEWDGTGWRPCSRTEVDDVAIRTPTETRHRNPSDPLLLEVLLEKLRGTWSQPDPPALVFDANTENEQGILVAVDDELRYREQDDDRWYDIKPEVLTHHLQKRGQPTLQSLSETPLGREHFTASPLTDHTSRSDSRSR
ncbi:hypothetical protein [Natrialba sp. SSL1]|uniref:hypothetical protein n=1 Tax=Natrialba sp. SSL1 TaxID=1869245 RepID=UPI0008F830AD|nr:hypothetical protein [Natrialba sp. SSL1]OIB58838.1 hypothetical protein BBD46_06435 [Natrialba sp. SSL1]